MESSQVMKGKSPAPTSSTPSPVPEPHPSFWPNKTPTDHTGWESDVPSTDTNNVDEEEERLMEIISPENNLEETFASTVTKTLIPPIGEHMRNTLQSVPEPWPLHSQETHVHGTQLAMVHKWLTAKKEGELVPDLAYLPDEEFESLVKETLCNDGADFYPGKVHQARGNWSEYLRFSMGPGYLKTPKIKELMDLLEEGVPPDWVRPDAACQQKHPDWEKRMAAMERMLEKHYGSDKAKDLMMRDEPGQ
eukprot:scaffold111943_cov37-Prasinocladus_malaysianus.AAC.1